MSILGSIFKNILKTDPTMREYIRVQEALEEHNRNASNWSDEERRWAEEATQWLNLNKEKAKENE